MGSNGVGCLIDTTNDNKEESFLFFLRLIGVEKYSSAFEAKSPANLYNQTDQPNQMKRDTIRQGIWDRIT
jgi:hypothetical protein